jgi:hypothetical protein
MYVCVKKEAVAESSIGRLKIENEKYIHTTAFF